jgi:hypothetical protein
VRDAQRLILGAFCAALLVVGLTACATIINGTSQSVSISSQPSGAQVFVDGVPMGATPVSPDLKRKDKHTVRIELEGYEPFEMRLNRGTSGWIAGNIIFGGLIGLAVDAITGAMYKISPDEVVATLERSGSARAIDSGDVLLVDVVLQPKPGWEHIGDLTPVGD